MDTTQIAALLTEIKDELGTPPGTDQDTKLTNFIKSGEYDIRSKVSSFVDFVNDLNARTLLKNFVRYSYYGQLDEFRTRYMRDYISLQVDYV